MSRYDIHAEPFDEGTKLKLDLFERYARSWLPTFISKPPAQTLRHRINLVDFFAGEGVDCEGTPGSALRILRVVDEYRGRVARPDLKVSVWLSDADAEKVEILKEHLATSPLSRLPLARLNVEPSAFHDRFARLEAELADRDSANLLIIDQYGVREVDRAMFERLRALSTTDFLFFVSSATFHRFKDVPAVSQYLGYERPDDYYKAHLAVVEAYRAWLPDDRPYYLGHFSIKKGPNIYGVIFGSGHPLGMAKFLDAAWELDSVTGTANFDIDREGIHGANHPILPGLNKPSKVQVFEETLARLLSERAIPNELSILELCFAHGVRPQHARPVITASKSAKRIRCDFFVPSARGENVRNPRTIQYL